MLGAKYEPWTIRQDQILVIQHWQACFSAPYIDIQDMFIPKKVLEKVCAYCVIKNIIFMVPENRSKFSHFPKSHQLVSFIHVHVAYVFAHNNVFSILGKPSSTSFSFTFYFLPSTCKNMRTVPSYYLKFQSNTCMTALSSPAIKPRLDRLQRKQGFCGTFTKTNL